MIESKKSRKTHLLVALLLLPGALMAAESDRENDDIEEIVVTNQRRDQPRFEHAGNITLLGTDAISAVGHQHVHELMTRVSGVWLSRGSGQEHLTAIRSPVLTGAGSCGGYLFLEDGVPIRPAGFCNVNQMFEMHTEQAGGIEVIRGPGNALYGSNALHGIVNVLSQPASELAAGAIALEAGSNEFLRMRGLLAKMLPEGRVPPMPQGGTIHVFALKSAD